jgi:hypothetical protein
MKTFLAAAVLALSTLASANAGQLDAPAGDVILTVTGKVTNTNADGAAGFDFAMLEALAGRRATMETPWTTGATTFDGPLLAAVLEAAGGHGKRLLVKALNDYSAEIPIEDATGYETILALRMNGAPMSVRDKGPLFLIYPFDKNPEIYNEKYFSRSVWQIREIEVVD